MKIETDETLLCVECASQHVLALVPVRKPNESGWWRLLTCLMCDRSWWERLHVDRDD